MKDRTTLLEEKVRLLNINTTVTHNKKNTKTKTNEAKIKEIYRKRLNINKAIDKSFLQGDSSHGGNSHI